MIEIHRLAHDEDAPLRLNPDLIAMVEETPDTVITLVTGQKIVAVDEADALVRRIRSYRVGLLADALAGRRPSAAPSAADAREDDLEVPPPTPITRGERR